MLGIENISWSSFLSVTVPITLALDGFFSYRCISKAPKEKQSSYTNKNDLANEEESAQSEEYTEIEPENATAFDDNYEDIPDMTQSEDALSQLADDLVAQAEAVSQNDASIDIEDIYSEVEASAEESADDNEEETVPVQAESNEQTFSETRNTQELQEYESIGHNFHWN